MVTTRETLRAAEAHAAALRQAAREADARVQELRQQGVVDEPQDGSIVRFTLRMSGKDYHYAALRVGKYWYPTGWTCPRSGYRWEALWRWINDYELVDDFQVVFEPEPLPF